METDRIAERDPVSCAGFIKRIWLEESKDPVTVYQEAARQMPDHMVALLLLFLQEGATKPYISGADKAAIFIGCVDLETSEQMRAWLATHGTTLPDPLVTPVKRQAVAREFLHMFYTQMAPSAFPRPN